MEPDRVPDSQLIHSASSSASDTSGRIVFRRKCKTLLDDPQMVRLTVRVPRGLSTEAKYPFSLSLFLSVCSDTANIWPTSRPSEPRERPPTARGKRRHLLPSPSTRRVAAAFPSCQDASHSFPANDQVRHRRALQDVPAQKRVMSAEGRGIWTLAPFRPGVCPVPPQH